MFSMDFLEVLPQSCYRATNTNWESLYNKRPNSIYEEVETKVRLSASDVPQSMEIEQQEPMEHEESQEGRFRNGKIPRKLTGKLSRKLLKDIQDIMIVQDPRASDIVIPYVIA